MVRRTRTARTPDRAASREKGRAQGQRTTLVQPFTLKFGTRTDEQKAHIDGASADDPEHDLDRVLTAPSIDNALSP